MCHRNLTVKFLLHTYGIEAHREKMGAELARGHSTPSLQDWEWASALSRSCSHAALSRASMLLITVWRVLIRAYSLQFDSTMVQGA